MSHLPQQQRGNGQFGADNAPPVRMFDNQATACDEANYLYLWHSLGTYSSTVYPTACVIQGVTMPCTCISLESLPTWRSALVRMPKDLTRLLHETSRCSLSILVIFTCDERSGLRQYIGNATTFARRLRHIMAACPVKKAGPAMYLKTA